MPQQRNQRLGELFARDLGKKRQTDASMWAGLTADKHVGGWHDLPAGQSFPTGLQSDVGHLMEATTGRTSGPAYGDLFELLKFVTEQFLQATRDSDCPTLRVDQRKRAVVISRAGDQSSHHRRGVVCAVCQERLSGEVVQPIVRYVRDHHVLVWRQTDVAVAVPIGQVGQAA